MSSAGAVAEAPSESTTSPVLARALSLLGDRVLNNHEFRGDATLQVKPADFREVVSHA